MKSEIRKAKLERQLHHIVLRYVGSDLPLCEVIKATSRPRDPLVQALLLIQECLNGNRLAKDAISAARSVSIQGADPELLVLFLSGWAELERRIAHHARAEALLHRAEALLSENTPYEIRARLLLVQSMLYDAKGNKQKREQLIREIRRLVSPSSPRAKFYTWELAMFLSLQGRGKEAESQIRELYGQCNEQLATQHVDLVRFIDNAETGKWEQARKIIPRVRSVIEYPDRNLPVIDVPGYEKLIELATSGLSGGQGTLDDDPDWIRVARALKSGNTTEALNSAREETKSRVSSVHRSGFRGFDLVRAELSAGNWEAAERLMDIRNRNGNTHYLDSFFLSRARLLAGDTEASSAFFAEALASVNEYDADGRLDLELNLAAEMKPLDIVRLTSSTAEKTATGGKAKRPTAARPSHATATVSGILGVSEQIQEVRQMVDRFAESSVPVLVTGETGTGKELVARALHENSSRKDKPFLAVNCGAIAESLLESELFGHKKGAFTGAEKPNKGLFIDAGEGTILLDEIGEIPSRLQTALLRVLETGEIRPVGSTSTRKAKCRMLAATNADLTRAAENNGFRKDLLYRLQRLVIHIPPLRERRDDIMLLARHFLDLGRTDNAHAEITESLEQALLSYDWPGNVRELRNVIERMRLMRSDKLHYTLDDLDLKFRSATYAASGAEKSAPGREEPAGEESREQPKKIDSLLKSGKSKIRRLDNLRDLFREYEKLTRGEIADITGFSPNTVTKDLKELINEGFIERIEPSRSTRSHYFILKKDGNQSGV